MERALNLRADDDGDVGYGARPQGPAESLDGLEKVLRFALPGRAPEAEPIQDRGSSFTAREMTRLMDLVHEAAKAIRAAEDRSRDYDARAKAIAERATEEIKSAEARTEEAESRARAAELRAHEAEVRAKEADNWLRQIFMTVSEELPVRRFP